MEKLFVQSAALDSLKENFWVSQCKGCKEVTDKLSAFLAKGKVCKWQHFDNTQAMRSYDFLTSQSAYQPLRRVESFHPGFLVQRSQRPHPRCQFILQASPALKLIATPQPQRISAVRPETAKIASS